MLIFLKRSGKDVSTIEFLAFKITFCMLQVIQLLVQSGADITAVQVVYENYC